MAVFDIRLVGLWPLLNIPDDRTRENKCTDNEVFLKTGDWNGVNQATKRVVVTRHWLGILRFLSHTQKMHKTQWQWDPECLSARSQSTFCNQISWIDGRNRLSEHDQRRY